MTQYKYQLDFAAQLSASWYNGNRVYVRTTIRNLKNKAQAAYIAGEIVYNLAVEVGLPAAREFIEFMHPNQR